MRPSGRTWLVSAVTVALVVLAVAPLARAEPATVFDPPPANSATEAGNDGSDDRGAASQGAKPETVKQACQDELNKPTCSFDELVASCSGTDSPRPSTLCINWARSLKAQPYGWATDATPRSAGTNDKPRSTRDKPDTANKPDAGGKGDTGGQGGTGSSDASGGDKGADRRNAHPVDVFTTLGGSSPFCQSVSDPRALDDCNRSGTVHRAWPLSHFDLDSHVDGGIDDPQGTFRQVTHDVINWIWGALLALLNLVITAMEWAFKLDLFSAVGGRMDQQVSELHTGVFGEPWFLAAISAAGLFALYHAFVRRKTIETIGGLAACVALMVVALVIINDPAKTVGGAERTINQASLAVVAHAPSATVRDASNSMADAEQRLDTALAVSPWCALNFGDVNWCEHTRPSTVLIPGKDVPDNKAVEAAVATSSSFADLWLRYPANEQDGNPRWELYKKWREPGASSPGLRDKIKIQQGGDGTTARVMTLGLVIVGMLGAIFLLAKIVVRLLAYQLLLIVLTVLAPVMLFAPALGDGGRRTFVAWLRRLVGALVGKFIYSVILLAVLVTTELITWATPNKVWLSGWVLQSAFFWLAAIKLNSLLEWVRPDTARTDAEEHGFGGRAMSMFYGLRTTAFAGGALMRGGRRAHHAAQRAAQGTTSLGAGLNQRRRARQAGKAHSQLDRDTAYVLDNRLEHARKTIDAEPGQRRELAHLNAQLADHDRAVAEGGGTDPIDKPTDTQLKRRRVLERQLAGPELGQAHALAARTDDNLARLGQAHTPEDRVAALAGRREAVRTGSRPRKGRPSDDELRWAGIDPTSYRDASGGERARLDDRISEARERHASQLDAVARDGGDRGGVRGADGIDVSAVEALRRRRRHRAEDEEQRRSRAGRQLLSRKG